MNKINFLIALHCHQPVDNFRKIFEEAYAKSYEPFLEVLERHPGIKLSLHYSGSLLDWILQNKPAFIGRIKKLIKNSQVEILTGGYFEPILPMILPEDAKGQISLLTRAIEEHFDYTPRGMWLAERVWDVGLPAILREENIRYTILDDFHFKAARVKNERIFGHYSVKGFEDFSVFASIKKLRYTMPFRAPEVTIDFLRDLCGRHDAHSVTFADDCEKFGLWPHTHDWVYRRGWLEKFFTALEKNDWIRTITFREALDEERPLGNIAIPPASYDEMVGWCGGSFNNFFDKYPESNLMKSRMMHLSGRFKKLNQGTHALGPEKEKKAKEELYKSQSNCAYWHGIFGGVYSNFLRQGIYRHIIKAENILADESSSGKIELVKLHKEKRSVVCAKNRFLSLFMDPDYAGAFIELDYRPLSYNLINTMSRRYEPYHEKLRKKKKTDNKELIKKIDRDESIDLYDVLGQRERSLHKMLNYDAYRKFSCLCHVMDSGTSFRDFVESTHVDKKEKSFFGPFSCEIKEEKGALGVTFEKVSHELRITKCIILEKDSEIFIKIYLENMSTEPVKFIFGMEFNWSIEDKSFMRPRRRFRVKEAALRDRFCGIKIKHTFKTPVGLWAFPLYTVNESERGIGRSFQEISLLFHKKLALKPGERFSLEAGVRISG